MKKISLLLLTCLLSSTLLTFAQEAPPINLYTGEVPNSKPAPENYVEPATKATSTNKVTIPTITPFFPEKGKANGTSVIICPGGGYSGLAIKSEGYDVAREFNKIGVTAFVLKYRLPSDLVMVDRTIGPLQDAEQAMLVVRSRAAEWGLNPSKIGIMGFSAGGHLASTFATHFNKVVIDNKANVSLRPDFAILMYPVITFGEKTHRGSKNNLVGATASAEMVDLYSNEKQVTANTPMTFIVHAADDNVVPIENTLMFYDALLKNKVSGEMHVYAAGGHGFGLNNRKSKAKWFDWCTTWMDSNGLLDSATSTAK
jgi:acetyl esterase/lipase